MSHRRASDGNKVWPLKRYGRFIAQSTEAESQSWKVFDGQLSLTLLQSGHLLVCRGQELLEGFCLPDVAVSLKVLHKSDTLLFRMIGQDSSRMFRIQFRGKSVGAAVELCGTAVLSLKDFIPVDVENTAHPSSTHPNTDAPSVPHGLQSTTERRIGDAMQGSLSLSRLAQYFLAQPGLSVPFTNSHIGVAPEGLAPLVRLCLLDHNFPALVEQVEKELERLAKQQDNHGTC